MAQQPGIVKGDVIQRIGSVGFILGGIILVIVNILFPRASDPSSTQEWLQKWGERETFTQVIALLLAAGIWALLMGIVGVYRSISVGAGAAFARLGFYGALVGTTLWTVQQALVMATAGAAANWLAAPAADKATAYSVAAAVYAASQAVYSMEIIVFWLALAFLGIGMVLSRVYPRWMGWVLLALGIITMVAVGVVQAFAGQGATLQVIFAVLAMLTILLALVIGVWVARKAW